MSWEREEFSPPVIDLSADEEFIVSEIKRACEIHGFFVVTNHNVKEELIENAREHAKAFFSRPIEEKLALRLDPKEKHLKGYVPLGAEASDVANLSLTGKKAVPKDLMESFQVGDPSFVENKYPENATELKETLESIYVATRKQGQDLLTLIGKAIGTTDGFFEEKHGGGENRSVMRITKYPSLSTFGLSHSDDSPTLRIGPHRDLGSITLLFQDEQGGLQVQLENEQWVHVVPVRNSIVVNLGNLMRRYCNGIFRSSIHRVVSNEKSNDSDRYSVILFINPDDASFVEPMPNCISETRPAGWEKINAGAYMSCKITQLFDENAKEFKGRCKYDD